MSRVKRGVTAHARHKKLLKQASGYRGRSGNTYRAAYLQCRGCSRRSIDLPPAQHSSQEQKKQDGRCAQTEVRKRAVHGADHLG